MILQCNIFGNISTIICDAQYVIKYYMMNYSYIILLHRSITIFFITMLLFYQHVIKHL